MLSVVQASGMQSDPVQINLLNLSCYVFLILYNLS